MTTLDGAFVTPWLDDCVGVPTDISAWIQTITGLGINADDGDATTFRGDGAQITARHIRGAVSSGPTLNGLFVPAFMDFLMPLLGKRAGSTLMIKAGSNAPATSADEVFKAEVVLGDVPIQYNAGAMVTLAIPVALADGGPAPELGYKG